MKKKKKETYDIELLILRIFLKHVKKHHLYHIFRCSVGIPNRHRDIFHTIASRVMRNYNNSLSNLGMVNPYYANTRSLEEFLATMRSTSGGNFKIENSGNCQMTVMNIVNGLIHSCIEYAIGNDFAVLEKIGEGVFTEVCQNLFGDEFVDKTTEMLKPEQMELLERYGRMIPPPNMGRRHRGDVIPPPHHPNQEEFQRWIEEYLVRMPHPEQVEMTQPTFRNDNMNVGYWGDEIEYEDEPWD
jgi:hypothetical protein